MTKQQHQKELLKIIQPGVKPSQLKKLKKSKSADDIPISEPNELENQISVLNLELEVKNRELLEKDEQIKELKRNPPTHLLQDQLKTKQQEIERLRQQLESRPSQEELDNSLTARHKSLKDWWQQYSKNKKLEQELVENIDEASSELINQDESIANLRTKNSQLQSEKQSLQKDLNLATKLAQLRKDYNPNSEPNKSYWKYAFYGLFAICFISLLNTSWKTNKNYETR